MKKFILIHEHKYGVDVYHFQMETTLTVDEMTHEYSEEICKFLEVEFDEDRDCGTFIEVSGEFKTIKL